MTTLSVQTFLLCTIVLPIYGAFAVYVVRIWQNRRRSRKKPCINYEEAISLDAEALAEGGIAEGYESVLPKLRQFVESPQNVEEDRDDDIGQYSVRCRGREFKICGSDLDEDESNSWGRATFALFSIVNEQLKDSTHRFYAINGGNDLFGIFLTPEELQAAQQSLPDRCDWPFLPKDA